MNKGIVLAGGRGTRLYPATKVISKQLLPLYDKPMIYYPISVLMLAKINEILIISDPENILSYKNLLGTGKDLGVKFSYKVQEEPDGIASAFVLAENFIGTSNVCLILGDNLFFGPGFSHILQEVSKEIVGANLFVYEVSDPERFGVVELEEDGKVKSILEKPKKPKSNLAITGLYFYDNSIVEISKNIPFSKRGEREITDVNKIYLKKNKIKVNTLGRGFTWLDTGTHDSFLTASQFIQMLIKQQGLQVACLEEIAWRQGWIDDKKLEELSSYHYNNDYGRYLKKILSFNKIS
jgi:glucose-1-phosphate thymidylyltransferase